ncbi:MAG: hypothetical protein A2621_03885 [Alphaproteobacteria bacterium RIFCSPHIGHO2_01_FULL_41_14]|nr:MAG: hypothetical protein A3K20_03680 [Alphaproteobacteria bacterium GWA1_45_9]OFW89991.1 MAG: hypothetical protein A2621_03885 [Alphaproteobacteria bacterium RIFCSPHIGHO2_01_FULL_41_14]HCI48817.1 hypothetical protein [Holosporales bacterium]
MFFKIFYPVLFLVLFSYTNPLKEGVDCFNRGDYEEARRLLLKCSPNDIGAQAYLLASQSFSARKIEPHVMAGLRTLIRDAIDDESHSYYVVARLIRSFWNLYSQETRRSETVLVPERRFVKWVQHLHETHHHRRSTEERGRDGANAAERFRVWGETGERRTPPPLERTSSYLDTVDPTLGEARRPAPDYEMFRQESGETGRSSPLSFVETSPRGAAERGDSGAAAASQRQEESRSDSIVEAPPAAEASASLERMRRRGTVIDLDTVIPIPHIAEQPRSVSRTSNVSIDTVIEGGRASPDYGHSMAAAGLEHPDFQDIVDFVHGNQYFPIADLFEGGPSEENGLLDLQRLIELRKHHGFYFYGTHSLSDRSPVTIEVSAYLKSRGLGALLTAGRLGNVAALTFSKKFLKIDGSSYWTDNCECWCCYGVPIGAPRLGCAGYGEKWDCGLGLCGARVGWTADQLCSNIRNVSRTMLENIVMAAGVGLLVLQQLSVNEVVDLGEGGSTVSGLGGTVATVAAYLSAYNNPKTKTD